MRILFLQNSLEPDGPGQFIAGLLSRLQTTGRFKFKVVSLSRGGDLEDYYHRIGIETSILNMPRLGIRKTYRAIGYELDDWHPDLVHTHLLRADLFGRLVLWLNGTVPFVSTEHGLHTLFHMGKLAQPFLRQAYLFTARRALKIVAISDAVRHALLLEGLPESRIVRIYNGADLEKFAPPDPAQRERTRRQGGIGAEDFLLGFAGRLETIKGLRYLFEALELLFPRHPRLKVWIIGRGALESELRRRADALGGRDRFRFFSLPADAMPRALGTLDLLAMPSLIEGFGMAAVEAMACGVPVVASNVGGLAEIVEEGRTGLLCSRRSVTELSSAIGQIVAHPEAAREMGQAARRRVEKYFSIDRAAEEYLEFYESLGIRVHHVKREWTTELGTITVDF
ncbi:MAG: glycosyltransferase family 4 protein [bacterium]